MANLKKAVDNPQKGRAALEALATGAALIAALILVNVVSCQSRAKLDLTSGQVYSLSQASKDIVRGMPEKVIIKAYFGNVPAEHIEKQNYVDSLLSEFAEASNGKVDYERIDPWSNPDLQAELKKEGIDKLRLRSMRDDTFEQVPMYFHVVFTHLDKKEIWTPAGGFALEGLEYEFISRIKRLGAGKKKVGITTGFGEAPQAQALSAPGADVMPGVKIGLGDVYDVAECDWSKDPKTIDVVDVLIVNGPTEKVSDDAKFALDQYIMRGKPVLFLAPGMKWQAAGQNQQQLDQSDQPYLGMPNDGGVNDLLATYGFQIDHNVIIDARNGARGWIPPGARQGIIAKGLSPYAESLQKGEKQMLQGLDVLAVPFASSITLTGDLAAHSPDDEVLELLRTAPTSFAHKDMLAITRDMKLAPTGDEHGPYLVAVAVAGKYKSFFTGKPVPADPIVPQEGGGGPGMPQLPGGGEADGPDVPAVPAAPAMPAGPLSESVSHTRLVVIGSSQMGADTSVGDIQKHGELIYVNGFVALHNMVDWLAEDTNLIAVRSKKVERPLAHVETGTRAVLKYGNIIGAPLILIIFGFIYWRVRESRRQNINI